MDLGFCFQDLGDGGDSFVKSFIEPTGHAYQDAMLEDLSVSGGLLSSSGSFYAESGWDDAPSFTQASYSSASPTYLSSSTHRSVASSLSSPSPLMTLADYEDSGVGVSLASMAPASLGLSYFDLQAGMEMPDAPSLGLYGLGNFFAAPTVPTTDPLRRSTAPSSSSSGHHLVLASVKQEHQHPTSPSSSSSAPSKVGAGVPGMWSPHDEPLKRKRKVGPGARRATALDSVTANTGMEAYPIKDRASSPPPKHADPCELPLLHGMELAGGGVLVGHRGGLAAVKKEDHHHHQGESGGKSRHHYHHHQQQQQQQQQHGHLMPTEQGAELVVERQPPVEVRTRTPSENRNFGVTVRITGRHDALHIHSVEVRLVYASSREEVNQQILGGKKTVLLKEDGRVTFDNLSMREASTKHGEREFCLEFVPLTKDGQPLGSFGTRTSPFYAYSHMKVLARRKSVKLRTLNKGHGSVHGGDKMHVIGQPFIKGPSLSIIFSTPHGDATALNPEMYSDSVLFFEAPPYPCPAIFSPYSREPVREVKVVVQVTNDGRTMSNPLEYVYIADKPVHRADF